MSQPSTVAVSNVQLQPVGKAPPITIPTTAEKHAAVQQNERPGSIVMPPDAMWMVNGPVVGYGQPNVVPSPYLNAQYAYQVMAGMQDNYPLMSPPTPILSQSYGPYGSFGAGGSNVYGYLGSSYSPIQYAKPEIGRQGEYPFLDIIDGQDQQEPFGSGACFEGSSRTVYVGNLPPEASVDELLSLVHFGPIESVKIVPEKSCAFISFLDSQNASGFHGDASMRRLKLHRQELRIGWGKVSIVPATVLNAVKQHHATRNVYIGSLDPKLSEQELCDTMSQFGPIDQVKIIRDKGIGFVHFLSISTAVKAVQTLGAEEKWASSKINFGKDRCAYVPKNQQQQQQHNKTAAAFGSMVSSLSGVQAATFGISQLQSDSSYEAYQEGNRTVYLGNIHPNVATEEICNIVRGGILQNIKYLPDRHICFVTFVETSCALGFYRTASTYGISLRNRRLKVGWGKHSGPANVGLMMAVNTGGSRNVYIGNIVNLQKYNEQKLRADFSVYGEIELVNTLPEKQCAFVNFTNIVNAIKAIEAMRHDPEYSQFKIAYGKDRCGGMPRHLKDLEDASKFVSELMLGVGSSATSETASRSESQL